MAVKFDNPGEWYQLANREGLSMPIAPVYKVNPSLEEGEFRDDGVRWVSPWWFPWENLNRVGVLFLGKHVVVNEGTSQAYIKRLQPFQMPRLTNTLGQKVLYATQTRRLSFWGVPNQGIGGAGDRTGPVLDIKDPNNPGYVNYNMGQVEVVFETLDYDIKEDHECLDGDGLPRDLDTSGNALRYLWIRGESSSKAYQIPANTFKYVDGVTPANPINSFGVVPLPMTDYFVTWYRVPYQAMRHAVYNPTTTMKDLQTVVGKVNKTTIFGCRKGTLRCAACTPHPIRSAILDRVLNVDFRFEHIDLGTDGGGNPIGHNHFPKFDTDPIVWYEINTTGGTTSNFTAMTDFKNPFNWAEFKDLFKPPTS